MANPTGEGSFINGESQAAELLAALSPNERKRILKCINTKNPQVARTLSQKCLDFNTILNLNQHEFNQLSRAINPKVLGIALKNTPVPFQKQILLKLERQYAEISYNTLISPQMNESPNIKRAQARVLEVGLKLLRNRQVL